LLDPGTTTAFNHVVPSAVMIPDFLTAYTLLRFVFMVGVNQRKRSRLFVISTGVNECK
jgi:hypothetical protein